ncbi:ABC transporter substrate-binding protein [Amycolatopsis jiangsuensis]|uniref:Iron complex transport system substrate-binding protein n=1 Tax=Amycolatopsis jiangsuensis TaxID=1181879 RepID=A0A840IMP2_9PSEU|nr:ABC transporter substrate-binding protein [Amycolatopsis jiangsuensis]MBB4683153.1 iron complex transport system substrate-binding protein [Amycolatopsis jiangsuensis]
MRALRRTAAAMALLFGLAACGSVDPVRPAAAPASSATTRAAACPAPPRLPRPPQRVVTMDGGAAAILERLGVADRIVGTAAPDFFTAFSGDEAAKLVRIAVIDPGQGNAEAVIAARPDLVVGVSSYSFGGFDGTPTVDQLAAAGAKSLVACDTGQGAAVEDLSSTTTFIRQLAEVFGVEQRGADLISEIDRAGHASGTPVRVLALSAPPAAGRPVRVQGGTGLANGVITLAGGKNVAEDALQDFATLSAEEIVRRDPQAIVVISGFSPVSDEDLLRSVRRSPVLAGTTAVKENRFVVVPQSILLSPSVLNGDAVAKIAGALHP